MHLKETTSFLVGYELYVECDFIVKKFAVEKYVWLFDFMKLVGFCTNCAKLI